MLKVSLDCHCSYSDGENPDFVSEAGLDDLVCLVGDVGKRRFLSIAELWEIRSISWDIE
jgi:hypothetical protein